MNRLMIISFSREQVCTLIDIVHDNDKALFGRSPFDSHNLRIGLRLVGDEGIYLAPDCPMGLSDVTLRAYAYEANPKVMLPEACAQSVELVFSAIKGEEKLSPEMLNQWISRTLLSTLHMEITAMSMRLIFDFDLDYSSRKVKFEDGVVPLDKDHLLTEICN